jgi:hypothetical protein
MQVSAVATLTALAFLLGYKQYFSIEVGSMTRLLLLALIALPLAASAQIYRTVDENGNVVFSDTPPAEGADGEEVELQPINTTPPPEPRPDLAPREPEEEAELESAALDYGVAITVPANETTIAMGPGNFSVSAVVRPALGADHRLQLYMDGTPWGDPQTVPSWALTNVFRGAHDITIAVTDAEGEHLAISEPVRVYVLRPSINFRNRN